MRAPLGTWTLACTMGVLVLGCGGDDDGGNDGTLDGGIDGGKLDASTGDGGKADAATFPCTSYVAQTATMCGGSHCQQTPAQLRADTPSTAVCGTDSEVTAFCSLKSVNTVGDCAVANVLGGPETKTCAQPKLTEVSSTCLDCYVASANCAREKCIVQCLSRETPDCDTCRYEKGCIAQFYNCAGFKSPLPPPP